MDDALFRRLKMQAFERVTSRAFGLSDQQFRQILDEDSLEQQR